MVGQGVSIDPDALQLMFDHNFMKHQSKFSIADAAEEWMQLGCHMDIPNSKNNLKESRTSTYHLRLSRKLLAPSLRRKEVEEFMPQELDGEGLDDLAKFNSSTEHTISKLAIKVLYIPSSFAQLERAFSNWLYVHCPLRSRLTFQRSKKLLHVYHTLKLQDVPSDEY
ncbi:hypothetical protein PR048_004806 [Dryococelus australis]|uniref:HAT C-terminal dimerisation domain-containing protein n=1 Tax=Dryococelus australis TaxID=614101 RepID=A0ABQ9I6H0_9NEOP|nr:hypothetical protein PR048_004806 [Dryococelus australis]